MPPSTKTWDGKGEPPSDAAARAWLKSQGLTESELRYIPSPGAGYGGSVGAYYRDKLSQKKKRDKSNTPTAKAKQKEIQDQRVAETRTGNARTSADSNRDGTVDPVETSAFAAGGGDPNDLTSIIAAGPGASATSGRGAPLWAYAGDPEAMAGITVTNRSWNGGKGIKWGQAHPGASIGARYYEADTWGPLKWSEEKRAALQRQMFNMGLYGNQKIRLGSWTAVDQATLAELLTAANTDGRTWQEQLNYWTKFPPEDLLAKINESGPPKPVFQVSNPADIRAVAQSVGQDVLGRVDRGFVEKSVGDYQGQELAAQQSAYSMSGTAQGGSGSGGTAVQAPSAQNYLAEKLRRENPIEADGYAFVGAFDQFLDMIGGR